MTAAAQEPAGRDIRHDDLAPAAWVEIAVAVGKTNDGAGLGDVDELRFGAGRIKRDPEGSVEPLHEYFVDVGFPGPLPGPQDADSARRAFREEHVAVGSGADQARIVEAGEEFLNLEARGD